MSSHFIKSVYRVLALMDIDPSSLVPNYSDETSGGYIALAVPSNKVGMALEGDNPQPLVEDGWYVEHFSTKQLEVFHAAMNSFTALSFEHDHRESQRTTKQTSRHEQWLYDELLRRGVPRPDRNLRIERENGRELTTPDFAWERYRVAFFVDGLWWHQAKDDHHMIERIREEGGELIKEGQKTRAERDARIRSELVASGWKVLSCTDRDLEAKNGIRSQADIIERVLRSSIEERTIVESGAGDEGDGLADLF